jgi:hypothetical protein
MDGKPDGRRSTPNRCFCRVGPGSFTPFSATAATSRPKTSRSFAGALVDANHGRSHQPMRWLIRLKIAASRLYGPAPAEMTMINMNAYKVSGR